MWYCSECGQKNEGRFCVNCGAEYYEIPEQQGYYQDYDPKPKKSGKGLIIAIIAVAALLIVGAIVGVMVFVGNTNEDIVEVQGTGVYYYVSTYQGTTDLYSDHNIESAVLSVLKNGDAVEFIEETNGVFTYVMIPGSGLMGYVRSDALVTSLDKVVDADPDAEIAEISLGEYYVTGLEGSLSLTDAPGTGGKTVALVENGYHVALIEQTSTKYWYVFDYRSGEYGYIQKGYLTDDPDKVTSGAPVYVEPSVKTIVADYMVVDTKNYLALRSTPSSSSSSEIGKTYNGNIVGLIEKTNSTFWYVYDYSSGIYGYVKCSYLDYQYDVYSNNSLGTDEYYVKGTKNYLALRSEPKGTEDVEIGKTYNGNVVLVIEKTNSTYWYVYDYNSSIYGYVKCEYLSKSK